MSTSLRLVLALLCLAPACQARGAAEPKKAVAPAAPVSWGKPLEWLYQGALKNDWLDFGWSPRELGKGPAKLDLSNYGGWILSKAGSEARFGGLLFKLQSPPDSIEVRLEGKGQFPRVTVTTARRVVMSNTLPTFFVPMAELNPSGRPFDQVVFQSKVKGELKDVLLDDVSLTTPVEGTPLSALPTVKASLKVDCAAPTHPISPMIYGVAFDPQRPNDTTPMDLRATARRWGGNLSTRYNWKLGNAWNTASDWFFRNVDYTDSPGFSYETFLKAQRENKLFTALTVPMLGWVAKDRTSSGFPREFFPNQQKFDPKETNAGNGKGPSGLDLDPMEPTLTSVAAPPSFMGEWVSAIRKSDEAGGRSVHLYYLDNEPNLWNSTHRDVHPRPLTYDELLEKTIATARAIRKADKDAVIAGPCEWGWTGYFYSAADTKVSTFLRPDRRAHGDVPLVPWYLKKLAEHEKKTGERLLDMLDLHYYPQGRGIGIGSEGQVDEGTNALRLRSTRSLWDPTYKDESWVGDTVKLIPRMKEWIAANYPGRKISIGEYNFGADTHPSGGLAQAEALGRFAEGGVDAAFVWYYPPKNSAAGQAFKAFRDFDGAGGRFLDISTASSATGPVSLFASTNDAKDKLVLIALNLDPGNVANAALDVSSCGAVKSSRAFQSTFGPQGFSPLNSPTAQALALPPYSVTVMELSLERSKK